MGRRGVKSRVKRPSSLVSSGVKFCQVLSSFVSFVKAFLDMALSNFRHLRSPQVDNLALSENLLTRDSHRFERRPPLRPEIYDRPVSVIRKDFVAVDIVATDIVAVATIEDGK